MTNHCLTRDNPNRYDGVSSDFYMACKNNDIDQVRNLIKNRPIEQLNQIESNGGTALHAAIYYDYPEIAELLLQHDCNPDITDRHELTARDNIRSKRMKDLMEKYAPISTEDPITPTKVDYNQVCNLFNELNRCASDKDDVPMESIVTVYMKPNNTERQSFLERILKVRWKIYSINRYKIPAVNNLSNILSIFKKYDRNRNGECKLQYEKVKDLLTSYERTKNVQHLLELYRATNSLEILHHDSIHMEIYIHLQPISRRKFQGRTYQGRVLTVNELLPFQWAFRNPGSILELRQLTYTLLEKSLAEKHIEKSPKDLQRLRALFIYDISQKCYTVIDTNDAPNCYTNCIRLLSGTFLEVTNIRQDIENGRLEIHLETVPLPLDLISQAIREVENSY